MNVIDLFAGAGGFSEGFRQAGCKINGFVEYWKPAIDTFKENFPEAELIGEDITAVPDKRVEQFKADVIIGGPPCQGFSMAGRRDPGDSRNTLFEHYLRFVEILKPDYCVLENVKGMYTMKAKDGEPIFNKILNGFGELGYEVKAKVLNAANYGVPQARQRVIFISAMPGKGIRYPKATGQRKTLQDVLNLPYEADESINHVYEFNKKLFLKAHFLKQGKRYSTFHSAGRKLKKESQAPTITKGGRFIHPEFNRLISVRESARIQSFPDSFKFTGTINEMYGQIGNAVPPLMAKAIAEALQEKQSVQINTEVEGNGNNSGN